MSARADARTHTVSIEIAAEPERIWALISDVTNMGRWSPVCRRCEWIDPRGPATGARFVGHNRFYGWRWSRECVVTESTAGRVFAFSTRLHNRESVRWRYTFEPSSAGTRVTESYEILLEPRYLKLVPHIRRWFRRGTQRGMASTLERVKSAAEAG